jgi:hypothetical protein
MAMPSQLTEPGPYTYPGLHVGETIQDFEEDNLYPEVSLYPMEPGGVWPSWPGSEPLVYDPVQPRKTKRYYITRRGRVVR